MSRSTKVNLRHVPWWTAFGLVLVVGCADRGPSCYPVQGEVRQAGKPLAEALVTLHPLNESAAATQRPMSVTDAAGHFQMTTFQTHDGAPLGSYAITVELRAPRTVGEESVRDGRNLLPARYGKPESSGLKYEVVAGENTVSSIDIAAK